MTQVLGSSFVPLHYGRSFICYRDVNKAIEQHREAYNLKLSLKKSTKLEHYPLTQEQRNAVNYRLKYAELDYTCSIDNGRVGRPGNDEKCQLLVRIRLSPDGQTLVVFQTHIHEFDEKKGFGKTISPPMPPSIATQSYHNALQFGTSSSPQGPQMMSSLASLPSPSALAASLVAAAAAAAGPSALAAHLSKVSMQQQQQQQAAQSPHFSLHQQQQAAQSPHMSLHQQQQQAAQSPHMSQQQQQQQQAGQSPHTSLHQQQQTTQSPHTSLHQQQQAAQSPHMSLHQQAAQSSMSSVVSPNNSLTVLPQFSATLSSSTPNSALLGGNVTISRSSDGSNISLDKSAIGSPLPGQLLIPSFYSSKSTTGHITFNSTGGRNSSSLLVNNTSIKPILGSKQSFNKSLQSYSSPVPSKVSGGQSGPKIMVKIKKSHFSPNEMVVVGSARHTKEQLDLRQADKTSRSPLKKGTSGGVVGGRINAVVANLLEKVVSNSNNSLSITHVLAPRPLDQSDEVTVTYASTAAHISPVQQAAQALAYTTAAVSASHHTGNRTSSGQLDAITTTDESVSCANLKRLQEKIRVKKAEKAALKNIRYTSANIQEQAHGGSRPLGSTHASAMVTNKTAPKVAPASKVLPGSATGGALHTGGPPSSKVAPGSKVPPGSGVVTKAPAGGAVSSKTSGVGRKMRKCRQRAMNQSSDDQDAGQMLRDNPEKLLPIDTELGDCSKQRIAQSVLLQLLRTITSLPMVQFSHAMETIGTLTDALRLQHRVKLSLHHDLDDDGAFALLGSWSGEDDLSPHDADAAATSSAIPVISLLTPEKRGLASGYASSDQGTLRRVGDGSDSVGGGDVKVNVAAVSQNGTEKTGSDEIRINQLKRKTLEIDQLPELLVADKRVKATS